ncbi:AIPR family protein [Belliella marina]|uniref:AIPR family protein n=1 Tax=Belliella marina TaxID=1644146 RepID=A0ABW4VNQ9_9BACT
MKRHELTRFRTTVLQDINDSIHFDRVGGIREEKFTEIAFEYLEHAGETEGAILCREIRENSIGNRIHKINGYALSEGYETVDLFITVFKGSEDLGRLYSDELKMAVSLCTRFLQNLLTGKLEGIEETAPVFDLVNTIRSIVDQIVRVNICILSDYLIPINVSGPSDFSGIKLNYHVRDIEYFKRIHTSGSGKEVIIINFIETFKESVPCLPMSEINDDYDSYLCIIPAYMLIDIYQNYGARLLEQNVRTFLQFRGKINKGIRDTILKEPHMFMAYNNGITATAEFVELTDDEKGIASIKDFQIVNGGQTIASIFQTKRKYKTADISSVCVQVKLSVIKDQFRKPEIVALISRYANTQNKVSEADLSSNHPFHIKLENLSRKIWTNAGKGKNQTRWFYERARGQYNDELYQIDSKAQEKKWLERNPKNQKFAKEDLARFYKSWEMEPWWVVRGRQKSFIEFMKVANDIDVDSIFYENIIAKAIIFRSAERLYGTGAKSIGDLRYMVVPYTVSWIKFKVGNNLNLHKIWKDQGLSTIFENCILSVLRRVDDFMRETAPGGLIGEWAKKTECWNRLKSLSLDIDFSKLNKELYDKKDTKERYTSFTLDIELKNRIRNKLMEIGVDGLIRINYLGVKSKDLSIHDSNMISRIIKKIEREKELTEKELLAAYRILQNSI